MKIFWSGRVPLLALMLLGSASTARADYLDWSYMWAMDPVTVQTISTKNGITGTTAGWVTPGTTSPHDAITLFPLISTTATEPDDMTIPNPGSGMSNYSVTLSLSDNAMPGMDPKTITMTGRMWGQVSSTGISLENEFITGSGQTVIGDYLYKVVLTKFTAPSLDGAVPVLGAIQAQITVERNQQVSRTPEPSSLILAGLVVPGMFWMRGRKRRNESA